MVANLVSLDSLARNVGAGGSGVSLSGNEHGDTLAARDRFRDMGERARNSRENVGGTTLGGNRFVGGEAVGRGALNHPEGGLAVNCAEGLGYAALAADIVCSGSCVYCDDFSGDAGVLGQVDIAVGCGAEVADGSCAGIGSGEGRECGSEEPSSAHDCFFFVYLEEELRVEEYVLALGIGEEKVPRQ